MTTPPEPPPAEPARGREAVDTVRRSGARLLLAGSLLAVIGIVLVVVGVEVAGVAITALAVISTVYGAYQFFVASPSGGDTAP